MVFEVSSLRGVSRKLQRCFLEVSGKFQGCFKFDQRDFQVICTGVSRLVERSLKGVSEKLHWCFKGVSRKFPISFSSASRTFEGYFKKV